MLEHYGQLDDQHITGQSVSAAEYNSLVRILDSQLAAALLGVGAGVISGGAVHAGGGLQVYVERLLAVVLADVGPVGLATAATATIAGLPPDSTLYLYAEANIEELGGEADAREGGTAVFTTHLLGGPVAGAVLLAKVITGPDSVLSVEDRRTFVPAQQALVLMEGFRAEIAALQAAVGSEYFGATPPTACLDERVTLLEEGAGGQGGSGPTYWGGLAKAAGDATSISQEIDSKIAAAALGGGGDGGTVVSTEGVWDVDAENQALALLARLKNSPVEEALAEFASQEDSIIVVWGVCGEGSNGTDDYVDRVHSTWLPG